MRSLLTSALKAAGGATPPHDLRAALAQLPDSAFIDPAELCAACGGISLRHAERMMALGKLPRPALAGRCRRWHLGGVRAALAKLAAEAQRQEGGGA